MDQKRKQLYEKTILSMTAWISDRLASETQPKLREYLSKVARYLRHSLRRLRIADRDKQLEQCRKRIKRAEEACLLYMQAGSL
jgi:hypothetical protein